MRTLSILILLSAWLSQIAWSADPSPAQKGSEESGSNSAVLSATVPDGAFALEELIQFARLFEQIKQNYVEEISDQELLNLAIEGLLGRLDPHSAYLNETKKSALDEELSGSFLGVGLELTMQAGDLIVVAPIDGSPAKAADLRSGDHILEINGQSTEDMGFRDALKLMEGAKGTRLNMLIYRDTLAKPIEVTVTRDRVEVSAVTARSLAHDLGYIRINHFQKSTGSQLQRQLEGLLSESPYIKGLILDLRDNPGGIVQAAIDVADSFIDEGLIVYTQGRGQGSSIEYYASKNTLNTELPMVVLINRGTASAAEIVAGALQDHQRALIMGDLSFGKGSVQNVFNLGGRRAIKLTTARYFTPSGRSIQAQGIFPDVTVLSGAITPDANLNAVSEASLTGHLQNAEKTTSGSSGQQSPEFLGFRETVDDIRDLQLAQAAIFLKGLAAYPK